MVSIKRLKVANRLKAKTEMFFNSTRVERRVHLEFKLILRGFAAVVAVDHTSGQQLAVVKGRARLAIQDEHAMMRAFDYLQNYVYLGQKPMG